MITKIKNIYNRNEINWEVYRKLEQLDCIFLWNSIGDKVKPIWQAYNPNIEEIKKLIHKLQS